MSQFYVYITTNPSRTVLYTGVTNNPERRLIEHYKSKGKPDSFAGKYHCYHLLYLETFPTSHEAIQAEKYIKGKSRKKKEQIIRDKNPSFAFLNRKLLGYWPPKYGI
ncbi:MAG: GIY-YIG nuclease family protein [Balneola sp.]